MAKRGSAGDRWSTLGVTYAKSARRVEASLTEMRGAIVDVEMAVPAARALLVEKPEWPRRAKDTVIPAFNRVIKAAQGGELSSATTLRHLPRYHDASHPHSQAHQLADAHDETLSFLLRLRVSLSRATIGDAVQVAAGLDETAAVLATKPSCGCAHAATVSVRQVTESVGEPVLAVGERVMGYGACAVGEPGSQPCAPSMVRIERLEESKNELTTVSESSIDPKLVKSWIDGRGCLPWVRVVRDPKRFEACQKMADQIGAISGSQDVFRLLHDTMFGKSKLSALAGEDQEVFVVILLDTQNRVRGLSEIARGHRDRAEVPIPDVLRIAIVDGAMAAIVAHNHPSGIVTPSDADKDLTKALNAAFISVRLKLLDHVIIGRGRYYSFADHNLL